MDKIRQELIDKGLLKPTLVEASRVIVKARAGNDVTRARTAKAIAILERARTRGTK